MLKKLFGKKPPAETTLPKLSNGISTTILNIVGSRSIPTMPGAAQKAFQLATDPKAEARDFVEVIESDEALSARVVKIANSVYFDRGHKSETIEECVTVIGMNELRCLLNATTLSEIMPSNHPARAQVWANDIATALIARNLAERLMPGKEGLAFLAGLMHDIGKLLLIQRASDLYDKVLMQVQSGTKDFCQAENEILAFNHTEVGQLIAEKWNFSPELVTAIRDHHQPLQDNQQVALTLGNIVQAADKISHALGVGHPKGYGAFRNSQELESVWRMIGADSLEKRKTELTNLKRVYETEADLYSGKV